MFRLRIIKAIMLLAMLIGGSFAQEPAADSAVLAITQYQLAQDNSAVYGLFDLGNKPSIRVLLPGTLHGKVHFELSGKHYLGPQTKAFTVQANFEDVTGRVFQEAPKTPFKPASGTTALWFTGLENVVGLYGQQGVELSIPAGAVVMNILGDDPGSTDSPNQLLGYVSHITFP